MSDFYTVEVLDVAGPEVELRVTIIHPDIRQVRTSATFAFSLLVDPLRERPWCDEAGVQGSPLAARVGADRRPDDDDVTRLACGFVRAVTMTSQHLHPPPCAWDEPERWRAFWEGEERPAVNLRLRASHPAWLAHLRVGMRWQSAAYSTGEGEPWPEPGLLPANTTEAEPA
ncbi:MAG: hypothetical protein H6710_24965 [Myxococcales bacterium]|nr:hypothetical protein [Myxococcales bacterium]MCB9706782.1 hypothetical protein [Myxococcales bacterium]